MSPLDPPLISPDSASSSAYPSTSPERESGILLASLLANRFLYSKAYITLYVILVILSVVSLIYTIATNVASSTNAGAWAAFFLFLEILINSCLVLEISIRMLAQRRQFFYHRANLVDLAVTVLCVVALVVFLAGAFGGALANDLLLGVRYAVQLIRLMLFIKNRKVLTSQMSATHDRLVTFEDSDSPGDLQGLSASGDGQLSCHDGDSVSTASSRNDVNNSNRQFSQTSLPRRVTVEEANDSLDNQPQIL